MMPNPIPPVDAAGRTVSAMVRRRRQRAVAAGAVLIVAAADIIGALAPRSELEVDDIAQSLPLGLAQGSRVLLLVVGLGLAVLARALWRGYRLAWMVALGLGVASALFHLGRDLQAPSVVLSLALVGALAATAGSFRAHARVASLPAVGVLALMLAGIVIYGLTGWNEREGGLPNVGVGSRLSAVARATASLDPGVTPSTSSAQAFLDSFRIFGAMLVLGIGAVALRPVLAARSRPDEDELRLFLATHGRSSTAPLAGLPGNTVLRLVDGAAVVGAKVVGGVAVTVGEPVAEAAAQERALGAFVALCERNGWLPVLMSVDEAGAERGRALGFSALKLGEEAIIGLGEFSLAGKARANVRHSVTRAEKAGLSTLRYTAEVRTAARDGELRAISDAWLASKHGPELGFTLGRFDPDRLEAQETYVAEAEGAVQAFVTWLPYDAGRAAVLDLMRRGPECPPGAMELLIARSLEDLRSRGFLTASLSGVPLASTTEREGRLGEILGWVYDHGGAVYEAAGLFRFKDKFAPRWEPIYLLYPTAADLPRVTVAIGRAFLPTSLIGSLRAFLRRT